MGREQAEDGIRIAEQSRDPCWGQRPWTCHGSSQHGWASFSSSAQQRGSRQRTAKENEMGRCKGWG